MSLASKTDAETILVAIHGSSRISVSLFVCDKCRCIENTATSRFWRRGDGPALCSQCDPEIGKWHGCFPRLEYDPAVHEPAYIDGEWVKAT
jgi:hypothetical protein